MMYKSLQESRSSCLGGYAFAGCTNGVGDESRRRRRYRTTDLGLTPLGMLGAGLNLPGCPGHVRDRRCRTICATHPRGYRNVRRRHTTPGDGCTSDCKLEPGWSVWRPRGCQPKCGDGLQTGGEQAMTAKHQQRATAVPRIAVRSSRAGCAWRPAWAVSPKCGDGPPDR